MVDPKDAPIIYIIGPNYFQNELLASFLKKEVGLECRHNTALNPTALINRSGSQRYLLLLDCAEGEGVELLKTPEVETVLRVPQCLLVFFNVDPQKEDEGELVRRGVRGAFYRSDPPRMLVKGVVAILEGELWYSRKILSKFLLREKSIDAPGPGPAMDAGTFLTPREREVLLWVAAGESNQAIADKLAISLHTVKTHIYRIFKKIQVPNRFQAALWAAKYLDA
jgi:LuxR family transcriptional regulator, positive regulator of biofilm formation